MGIDLTQDRVSTSLTEQVGDEIRQILTRRRAKQSDLARALGKSEQWISVRLRGVQPIDLNDLQMIADALGVVAADLVPRPSEGRVLTTIGQTADEQRTRIKFSQSPMANRSRPNGHPKRPQPHPSLRRPGRLRPAHA